MTATANQLPARITLTTTGCAERGIPSGVEVEVFENSSGVAGGFGRVVNGYLHGLEHFDKVTDGDTVVACEADHPAALPIADAYWELHRAYDEELVDMLMYELAEGWTTMDDIRTRYGMRRNVMELLAARQEDRLDKDIAGNATLMGDPKPLTSTPFADALKDFRA